MKISMKNIGINLFYLLLLIYMLTDFNTGANINVVVGDRGLLHLLLFSMILVLFLMNLFTLLFKSVSLDSSVILMYLLFVWIMIVGLLNGNSIWVFLVHLGLSFFWIQLHEFSRHYIDSSSRFKLTKKYILLFLVITVIQFLTSYINIRNYDGRVPVVNLIYYILAFIPWFSIVFPDRYRNIFYFIVAFLVIISSKRGAIIIYPLMLFSIYLSNNYWRLSRVKLKSFAKYTTLVILLLVISSFVFDGFLISRFSLDSLKDASGRTNLFSTVLNDLSQRTTFSTLIGTGPGSSIELLGTGVHNEWLEFLFSYGVIGIILYFSILATTIKHAVKLQKEKSSLSGGYWSLVVYFSIIGLFDGFYFMHSSIYVFLFIGFTKAKWKGAQKIQK